MKNYNFTICYFGTYRPDFSRSNVYINGLKIMGVKIIECNTDKLGIGQYLELIRKFREIKENLDVIIIGYPGYSLVPLARLLTKKPIIFDALCSMYEAEIISRGRYKYNPFRKLKLYFQDWLDFHLADISLVESKAQKKYLMSRYGIDSKKLAVLYTGLNSKLFYSNNKKINHKFTVLFRGRLMPEAGLETVIEAAKLLQDKAIHFLIIGFGIQEKLVGEKIKIYKLKNIEWVKQELPIDILRQRMEQCDISLGQFSRNSRVDRTIPHKAFESMSMKLPYITAKSVAVAEIMQDSESCLFVQSENPKQLADAIFKLYKDQKLGVKLAQNAYNFYLNNLTPEILAQKMLTIITKNH